MKATGGPAFPQINQWDSDRFSMGETGMTLRDYFAAKATEEDVRYQADILRWSQTSSGGIGVLPDDWRTTARYMHADAMLKAREQ